MELTVGAVFPFFSIIFFQLYDFEGGKIGIYASCAARKADGGNATNFAHSVS